MNNNKEKKGISIAVKAIEPNGKTRCFISMSAAARYYGVSPMMVSKSCSRDLFRPYRSKDKTKRPTRFCLLAGADSAALVLHNVK